ncbi:MAG: type II toxin-antitoxin system HicA family toxin [Methanospirillaceae archaeon]|nr:type II toxin-antitoxin system HicA family toxin [Methanospirillaceae archaeon]
MKEKLPRITADKLIPILEKKGFTLVRQSGSHKIYRNDKQVRVTVPYHSGEILHPKILKQIIIDADLTLDDLK